MTCQLPSDCLNEIFEYLEEDRNIWKFKTFENNIVASSILSTLISCSPNESKELIYKNKVFILTPTSKLPLFNYVAFCKVLSINFINETVCNVLKDELLSRKCLVTEEIIKMFANQIYPLNNLFYHDDYSYLNFSFPYFPGLRDLSELRCVSNLPSNFFNQLSQISPLSACGDASWKDIIPALKNNSNAIIKLYLYGDKSDLPLSFVALQHVKFSDLQTLKFPYQCPRPEYIMKFLENNGKNLQCEYSENVKRFEIQVEKYCPHLNLQKMREKC
ncbi:hypothetical protein GLOIN_2v1669543 [Rhizophagus clarus]|uniref:F-box domain-containing protein n=1 Tax=Rhizophagus clarus TaxID=94130 RepID=A0A8H3KTK4_9GLOM|nr:hypothetical protein GLOIN_2v1669543 [Rhizophagus clarus]